MIFLLLLLQLAIIPCVRSYEFFHRFQSLEENVSVQLHYRKYDQYYKIALTFSDAYDQEKKLSFSSDVDGFLKSDFGPDEIFIKIQGKGLYSYIPAHKKEIMTGERRRYEQLFRVDFTGSYHMMGMRIRKNYAAINELNFSFPEGHYAVLFSEWLFLNSTISNKDVDLWHCNDEVPGNWVERFDEANVSLFDNSPEFLENISYPVIIKQNHFSEEHYTIVNISTMNNHHQCLSGIEKYEWKPSSCSGGIFYNPQEASEILKGKTIILQGDSQTRTFIYHLLTYACGNSSFDGSNIKKPIFHVPERESLCAGLKLHYIYETYCAVLPDNIMDADIILVNCGQHPASGTHMAFEKYQNAVRTMLDDAYSRNFSSKRIVWFESLPFPLRNDENIITYKDWRTLQRISLFNRYSDELFSERGHKIIRSFHPLLAFWDQLCNDAHAYEKSAHDPNIQQLLYILKTLAKVGW